jgi:dihydrofolate synthase/folylpolyglutamate synthase
LRRSAPWARPGSPTKPISPNASLDDWLRWQEALHPQSIALGLERVRPVAARLGLPASGLRTITVAGTNGKGSCTALLTEIYRAAGYRVGTYQSPHLRRYNERVALDGRAVADAALIEAFAAVEWARQDTPLTYFEYGTLAALRLFAGARLDLQVLEVGLGGRLDAVNLVDADAALVTAIGLDHVEFLGGTREQIGLEKAGIFRRDRPAACADPAPPASIARHAQEIGAPLWQLGREFHFQHAADAWNWHGPDVHYKKLPPPALAGEAQFRNAAGALAVVTRLQRVFAVPEPAIRSGLARLRLPGRFERRGDVILDVAHNVEAARELADNLRKVARTGLRIVVGMLSDKPVEEFCAVVAPLAEKIHAGGLPPPRGLDAQRLLERVRRATSRAVGYATVAEAFRAAQAERRPGEVIVVCGSFLTVAAVAELLDG